MFNLEIEIKAKPGATSGATLIGPQSTILVKLVKEMLPCGGASIGYVAMQLRTSVRTLQRHLKACGFTFKEIVDDVRRTSAIHYVLAGEIATTEIALMLGYSDQAHFTRAFKRWTGVTPGKYRP